MFIVNEAFPFCLEYILKHRKVPVSLLLRYGVMEKVERGRRKKEDALMEIQPHLKGLPLKEQVPFISGHTEQAVVKLIVDCEDKPWIKDGHEFYFFFMEHYEEFSIRLPSYSDEIEMELIRHGFSFANFKIETTELPRALAAIFKSEGEIGKLLLLSKKHTLEIYGLLKVYDDLDTAQNSCY